MRNLKDIIVERLVLTKHKNDDVINAKTLKSASTTIVFEFLTEYFIPTTLI